MTLAHRMRRAAGAAGAAAFAPTDIAGLTVWLRADLGTYEDSALTTPAADNADVIGGWADQSGNGNNYTQGTAAQQPTLRLNVVNGQPVIRFVGTSSSTMDYLAGPSLASLTAAEVFLVIEIDADPPASGTGGLWDFGTNGNSSVYPYTDGNIYDGFGTDVRKDTIGDPTPSLAAWRLYNIVSVSGEWTNFLDGTQLFTTATNTVAFTTTTRIGVSLASGNFWLNGDIAEFILYNAKLSADDKASVESYIADRYGLTIA